MSHAPQPDREAVSPMPLRDTRPRNVRIATAATLVVACLAITGFVQSLRDTALSRLPSPAAPTSTGIGTSLRAAPARPTGESHWLVFFGIGGALVLIGCGIAYVTSDPLADRAHAARAWADTARARRADVRSRLVDSVEEIDTLDANIAVTVVNATRDIWVAAGWSEVDVLERMRANPAFTGTWAAAAVGIEPGAKRPVAVGEALGTGAADSMPADPRPAPLSQPPTERRILLTAPDGTRRNGARAAR